VEAEERYRQALSLLEKLAGDLPRVPKCRSRWAATLHNLALLLRFRPFLYRVARLNQGPLASSALLVLQPKEALTEARQCYREAIDRQQEALKLATTNELKALPFPHETRNYRTFLREYYRGWVEASVELGDHAAAVKAAREMAHNLDDGVDYRDAACSTARSVALAEKDPQLLEDQRKQLAQNYVRQALDLLQKAVAKGIKPEELTNDRLAPLRPYGDFQQLLRQLKGRGKPNSPLR
jgi:hypothetical protein